MSTTQVAIQASATPPQTLSPFRTRWGSELAAHEGNPDFVLSLARGLKVMACFEGHPEGLTIAEISRTTALSRAAVRRLLITLELLGYIEADARKYRLQRRVSQPGSSSVSPANGAGS
jgi:IclR family pca regulon transcriptional regulator